MNVKILPPPVTEITLTAQTKSDYMRGGIQNLIIFGYPVLTEQVLFHPIHTAITV